MFRHRISLFVATLSKIFIQMLQELLKKTKGIPTTNKVCSVDCLSNNRMTINSVPDFGNRAQYLLILQEH